MVPFYRIAEVTIYFLFGFLPLLLLALLPFQNQLRFSRRTTGVLVALVILAQIVLCLAISIIDVPLWALPLFLSGAFIPVCFFLVKARFGKVMFTVLALSSIANLLAVVSGCLENLILGELEQETYRWIRCLCIVAINMMVTVPLFFYGRSQYAVAVGIESITWKYLWAIPAIFHLIWLYHLYLTGQSVMQLSMRVKDAVFPMIIGIGAVAVYHTAVLLLLEQDKAQKLSCLNHQLRIYQLQYENLQSRINEARQAKHDVRHHIHLIREYLRTGKLPELESYLDHYSETLPSTHSLVHCQHYATNALLSYFAHQAQDSGIEMDIFVQLPEVLNLPETSLSVVLGNLLENAVDACREISEGTKKITVRGNTESGYVFFEVSNTFPGDLRRSRSGKILSTKAGNRGLGLESVAHLASSHGGMFEVDTHNGIFRASVLLQEESEDK